jgi:hypothetical protein
MQVHIIIETSLLLEEYSNPSLDENNPTPISDRYVCLVKAGESDEIIGLEKNEINFKKELVDEISFYAISESANFDNPVILYNLKDNENSTILEEISLSDSEMDTVVPERFNPLETVTVKKTFLSSKSKVLDTGKGEYGIHFGVFSYDFTPLGYFEFPVTLSID